MKCNQCGTASQAWGPASLVTGASGLSGPWVLKGPFLLPSSTQPSSQPVLPALIPNVSTTCLDPVNSVLCLLPLGWLLCEDSYPACDFILLAMDTPGGL